MKDSPTAMQLKQQLLPDNLKQFEGALKGIGIDPDKDVDTLTFASFRTAKQGIKGVGVAAGACLPFGVLADAGQVLLELGQGRGERRGLVSHGGPRSARATRRSVPRRTRRP